MTESVPVFLGHFCDCDVERLATRVQQIGTPSAQVDVCAVVNEWVALCHISLQAVPGAVLGQLQLKQTSQRVKLG